MAVESVTLLSYTAYDFGGSTGDIVMVREDIPTRIGAISLRSTPEKYGVQLPAGMLYALLESWVLLNTTEEERNSVFVAKDS